jgi:hypothetical protein
LINRRSLVVETALVTALLVLGFAVGLFAGRHYTGQPLFYQAEFGPAVMVAAGRGFVNPMAPPGSALSEFLQLQRPALSPGDVADVGLRPLRQFQYGTRYLILAVGYIWRVSGISWANVANVGGLLYGLSVVACYAICRVWLSRPFAVAGAMFICFSPLHLAQVAHVRDYSKGPFILLAIALTAWAVVWPVSRRMLLLLSAACGAAIGFGLGFKMDVVIMAPIFVISLIAFRARRPWTGIVEKMLATGAFVAALAASGGPVLAHLSSGGTNGFHVILLGYADEFDEGLGVTRSVYRLLPFYSDGYLASVLKSDGARRTGQFPEMTSPAYDNVSRAYWLTIVRHFPADVLTRALAASNGILNLPFTEPALDYLSPPAGRSNPLWNALTNKAPERLRVGALFESLAIMNGWGVMVGVLLIATAGVESARLGLFSAWMLAALTGYSSLQFAPRHFFHLEIIPVFGLLVVLRLIARRHWPSRPEATRFALAVVATALSVAVPVAGLRAYQRAHLSRLFQAYIDAPRHQVQPVFADVGGGVWRVQWDAMSQLPQGEGAVASDYLVLEFESGPEARMSVVGVRYKSTMPATDFSRVVTIPASAGVNRIFIPTYGEPPKWGFDGLELPSGVKNSLRGIYRVAHPEQLPLLLDLRLSGTWRQEVLNQTFRVEGGGFPDNVQVLGLDGAVSPIAVIGRVDSSDARPNPADVGVSYTNAVRVTSNRVEVDGRSDTWSSYLLSFKPVHVEAPAALLVQGHLDTGGVVVGLLKNNRWYRQQVTSARGDFVAVIEITESGTYTPIVTNATRHNHDLNRFVLSRFGIVTSQTTQLR